MALKEHYIFHNGIFGTIASDKYEQLVHYKILGIKNNLSVGHWNNHIDAFKLFVRDVDEVWLKSDCINYDFVPEEVKRLPNGIIKIELKMEYGMAKWTLYQDVPVFEVITPLKEPLEVNRSCCESEFMQAVHDFYGCGRGFVRDYGRMHEEIHSFEKVALVYGYSDTLEEASKQAVMCYHRIMEYKHH